MPFSDRLRVCFPGSDHEKSIAGKIILYCFKGLFCVTNVTKNGKKTFVQSSQKKTKCRIYGVL